MRAKGETWCFLRKHGVLLELMSEHDVFKKDRQI